jgi:hypothetical protein
MSRAVTIALLLIPLSGCDQDRPATPCGSALASPIELPRSAARTPLTVAKPHTLEVTKDGVVSVDGVAFASDDVIDVRLALVAVAKSMRQKPEYDGPYSPMLPDEELVIRIDAAAPFSTAAKWLEFCGNESVMLWDRRVAVVDPKTSSVAFLTLPSIRMTGVVNWNDTVTKTEPPSGTATMWASLWPHSGDARTGCGLTRLPPSPRFSEIRGTSWEAVCAIVEERRVLDTFLWLEIGVDPRATWQDAIGRIDESLDLGVESFILQASDPNAPDDR